MTVTFDNLPPVERERLVDHVQMLGEGPGDLVTTRGEAEAFLRSLNATELAAHQRSALLSNDDAWHMARYGRPYKCT